MGLNDTLAFLKEKHPSKPEEKESKVFQLEEKYWNLIMHGLRMYAKERQDKYREERAKGKTKKQLNRIMEDMENIDKLLDYLRENIDKYKKSVINF